jgi:hypothetical protein
MPMSPRLLRPVAAGGFNPKRLADLTAWYDASVVSSLTLSSGAVSQWNDLSGGNYHLTQTVANDRPTFQATSNVNSRPGVQFNGTNAFLRNASVPGAGSGTYSLFVVINSGSAVSNQNFFEQGVDNGDRVNVTGELGLRTGNGNRLFTGSSFSTTPRSAALSLIQAGTAHADVNVFENGSPATQTSVTSATFTLGNSLILGGRFNPFFSNVTQAAASTISEYIYYRRALPTAERERIESYLRVKWGF